MSPKLVLLLVAGVALMAAQRPQPQRPIVTQLPPAPRQNFTYARYIVPPAR